MILVTFTRQSIGSAHKQMDYGWFDNVESIIEWFNNQGDKPEYNLIKKNRSLTQYGWIDGTQLPAQVLRTTNTAIKIITQVDEIVSDEGILFSDIQHCSEQIIDCMALKYVLK
jgi:hypothetical protein